MHKVYILLCYKDNVNIWRYLSIMKNGFIESAEMYLKQNQLKLVLCQTFSNYIYRH